MLLATGGGGVCKRLSGQVSGLRGRAFLLGGRKADKTVCNS